MRRSGRSIAHPAACRAPVVRRSSSGDQRPTRITPPISPARIFARNEGFGGPASALTMSAPTGAAAALGAYESRSRSAVQAQARPRVEEVESRYGSTASRERPADAGGRLRVDAGGEDGAVGGQEASSSPAASRTSLTSTGGASTGKITCASAPRSSTTCTSTSIRGSDGSANAASSNASGRMPTMPCRLPAGRPGSGMRYPRTTTVPSSTVRLDEVHRGGADEGGDEEVDAARRTAPGACPPAGPGRRASPRRAGRASSPRPGRA